MNASAQFQVTPEAGEVVAHLLQEHPDLQAGFMMVPNFEVINEQGAIEARYEGESFWVAYDSADKFSHWPHVELCGRIIPIAPDALERLKGKTLILEACDCMFEGQRLLIAT